MKGVVATYGLKGSLTLPTTTYIISYPHTKVKHYFQNPARKSGVLFFAGEWYNVISMNNQKRNQGYKLFSDESGCLDNQQGYVVVSVIQFATNRDYKHWKKIVMRVIKNNKKLKVQGEIKGNLIGAPLKNKIFRMMQYKKIDFKIWVALINKYDSYYIAKYVKQNQNKEIVFNYAFNKLFQNEIAPIINKETVCIDLDIRREETGARQNLREYIDTTSKNNPNHKCDKVILTYDTSHTNYGIQLADLVSNTIYRYLYQKENFIFEKYLKDRIQGKFIYPESSHSPF